jgi:hypothetical protein
MHQGAVEQVSHERAELKNYRLTKFRASVSRLGSSDQIKSLRDEIGILRMMMEERLNQCEDASDLLLQSHTIGDLAVKIQNAVTASSKLEAQLGQTMDKQALLNFASGVIGIIGENIEDPDVLDVISNNILALLGDKDDSET